MEYDDEEVSVNMLSGILTLRNMNGASTNVVVRSLDQFRSLSRVSIKDQSTLVAKDLRADSLAVEANTSGNIKIEGVMNLNRLVVDSRGDRDLLGRFR